MNQHKNNETVNAPSQKFKQNSDWNCCHLFAYQKYSMKNLENLEKSLKKYLQQNLKEKIFIIFNLLVKS